MLLRFSLLLFLAAAVTVIPVAGDPAHYPVGDLRPGMVGEGVTRLEGGTRVTFKAHVLGVLDNVIGPRRQVILARLEGAGLEHTGVIAGMSGSPVYVDGRLLGAVAYSMGQFSKEPIAGITPIGEMLDATAPGATSAPRTVAALPLDTPLTHEALAASLQDTLRVMPGFRTSAAQASRLGLPGAGAGGIDLVPIATPLTVSGFGAEAFQWIGDIFGPAGFAPVSGQASSSASSVARMAERPLEPGDAVGVSLVRGDLTLGATGTVTYVDGPRVLAFGHPFFNLGPTRMPMTQADVITVVPSLLTSIKLAAFGPVLGVVDQDRATAIAGTLGSGPRTVPVRLSLNTNGAGARTFAFEVAEDQLFTPVLVFVSVANVLQSYQRELGASTIQVAGEARIGDAVLRFDDVHTGDSALISASASLAAPLSAILRSDLGTASIDGIDLTVHTEERSRTSRLEDVWLSNPRPRAGTSVNVHVKTRTFRAEPVVHRLSVPVPASSRGPLQIQVIDGGTLAQQEGRRRTLEQARSIPELVTLLNASRRADRWYVRLVRPARGTVVGGRDMPALPGTVLAVLDGTPGAQTALDVEVLGEWEVAADAVATGRRTLNVTTVIP
jgi:hypothetical protein